MGRPRTQKKRDYVGVLSSVFAIIIGLLVGFVILLLSNPSQAVPGFITINPWLKGRGTGVLLCHAHYPYGPFRGVCV